MKKNSFLVKTVLMSMLTAVSISFASCSDDDDLMTNPYTTDDSEVAMTRGGSASDAFKPNVDHSQWMAQLNNSRLVADLSLPGTHDACTGEGWHLASQIGKSAATTQDLTIDEQLKVGVRVFDLRPERVLSTTDATYDLRCCHGIMQTELLVKDFFIKMRDFLRENPTEFCIVTSNVTDTPDMNAWAEQFAGSHQGTLTLGLQSARFTFSDYQEYEGVYYSRIIASTSDWRNQEQHEKNFSSFLQVKHRWGPVIANVGVRYDHVKRRTGKTNNELSPRMALIFMQPRWGSKLCYSTSFVDRAFKHRCITESYTDPESASPEYSRC